MNTQKDKNQGGDNRSDKSKQQSTKGSQTGSQHEMGYKPENPGTFQKGKQEQPPRPQNSPSQSSTTNRPGEKPWEPGDKPVRQVEGEDDTENGNDSDSREDIYAHGKEDKKKDDKSKR
jgi:hypothetical protein